MLGNVEQELIEAFKSGGGVPYASFEVFAQLVAENSGLRFDQAPRAASTLRREARPPRYPRPLYACPCPLEGFVTKGNPTCRSKTR